MKILYNFMLEIFPFQSIFCQLCFYGQDFNEVLLCILASSEVNKSINSHTFLDIFRQVTGYEGDVVLCIVHEPSLESNLLVTTVVALG